MARANRQGRDGQPLREGFTTGTAAAAAAKAAAVYMLTGERPKAMDTPLPPGGRLEVPIDAIMREPFKKGQASTSHDRPADVANSRPATVRARVIKDGGDDPDATHGHAIEAVVTLLPQTMENNSARSGHSPAAGRQKAPTHAFANGSSSEPATDAAQASSSGPAHQYAHGTPCAPLPETDATAPARIMLHSGIGVGLVTLPGLPVPPGQPAINPDPRRQIIAAVSEALDHANFTGSALVTIEVPQGEAIAAKTMNQRLGIVGGISILGTRGTVKPFSHESYAASIRQGLDVARAQGVEHVALTTGGRTETLVRGDLPHLPALACVQFADFFGLALREAAARGFAAVTVGCYFGKLVKMAQGFEYTHAKDTRINFRRLARWFAEAGIAPALAAQVETANTARHALELVWDDPAKHGMLDAVTSKALACARGFAGPGPALEYRVYAFDGTPLIHCKGD